MDQEVRDIYKLDKQMSRVWKQIKAELSAGNFELIEKYDTTMVNVGIAKSTRIKHIKVLLSLTRKLNKDWSDASKEDIDHLIRGVIDEYGDNLGGETETTRDYREIGDPKELKSIRLKQVKDKIVREQLLTEEDRKTLLVACADNARDRAFLDVHYEAGTRPREILSLQIKHVKFDDIGAIINVDGKTGGKMRRMWRLFFNISF